MSNALQETRSMLKNLAVEYGPNSPITRIAYNMLEQTELLPTYSRSGRERQGKDTLERP